MVWTFRRNWKCEIKIFINTETVTAVERICETILRFYNPQSIINNKRTYEKKKKKKMLYILQRLKINKISLFPWEKIINTSKHNGIHFTILRFFQNGSHKSANIKAHSKNFFLTARFLLRPYSSQPFLPTKKKKIPFV